MIPYGEIFLDNNKGVLIGGRNRAEAWDPSPPVLAINVKRRHSKSRQAMAQALIYPDPEKGAVRDIQKVQYFWQSPKSGEPAHRRAVPAKDSARVFPPEAGRVLRAPRASRLASGSSPATRASEGTSICWSYYILLK
jgi:hypothetical protein